MCNLYNAHLWNPSSRENEDPLMALRDGEMGTFWRSKGVTGSAIAITPIDFSEEGHVWPSLLYVAAIGSQGRCRF